jgi:hypothetical protein
MIISTIFNYQTVPPLPLYSMIYDGSNIEFLPLYMKKLGTKLSTVFGNLDRIESLIKGGGVILNDAVSLFRKLHPLSPNILLFEWSRFGNFKGTTEKEARQELCKLTLQAKQFQPAPWMEIKGRSAIIYTTLEQRGIRNGPYIKHPIYDTKTFTGRSRTSGFNIQGVTEADPIDHVLDFDRFICFDWAAADIGMAGILSGDKFIKDSYQISDPYEEAAKLISCSDLEITRSDCKIEMLKGIYALDLHNPMLGIFPGLRDWIIKKVEEFDTNYQYRTLLGMPIPKAEMRSSFNALIQGSVAEAIQSVIIRLGEIKLECILTETHDSLIVCCNEKNVSTMVEIGSKIMLHPFYHKDFREIKFPVHVNIGKKWKHWARLRTYR